MYYYNKTYKYMGHSTPDQSLFWFKTCNGYHLSLQRT